MHIHKTGALIRAGVLLGAFSRPEVESTVLERLDRYAKCIGLAFQIRDDILDVVGDTATLGKTKGPTGRSTSPLPRTAGFGRCPRARCALHQEALASLEPLGPKPIRCVGSPLTSSSVSTSQLESAGWPKPLDASLT